MHSFTKCYKKKNTLDNIGTQDKEFINSLSMQNKAFGFRIN